MSRKRYKAEEIIHKLREAEVLLSVCWAAAVPWVTSLAQVPASVAFRTIPAV